MGRNVFFHHCTVGQSFPNPCNGLLPPHRPLCHATPSALRPPAHLRQVSFHREISGIDARGRSTGIERPARQHPRRERGADRAAGPREISSRYFHGRDAARVRLARAGEVFQCRSRVILYRGGVRVAGVHGCGTWEKIVTVLLAFFFCFFSSCEGVKRTTYVGACCASRRIAVLCAAVVPTCSLLYEITPGPFIVWARCVFRRQMEAVHGYLQFSRAMFSRACSCNPCHGFYSGKWYGSSFN